MDDFFDDNEDVFIDEIGAYERAAMGGVLNDLLEGATDQEGKRAIHSDHDRFLINANALCREINDNKWYTIGQADIDKILTVAHEKVIELKYKNYVGFVLGYLASPGVRNLKKKNIVMDVFKLIPKVGERAGIEPPDVIRYARYWELLT